MTKQEKIREGLAERICDEDLVMCGLSWQDVKEETPLGQKNRRYYRNIAMKILNYPHSQGVVIKSDSVPEYLWENWEKGHLYESLMEEKQ